MPQREEKVQVFSRGVRKGRTQSTGIPLRLLIAGGMAMFAIVSYFMMGQQNPFNKENQRVGLDPQQEIALGLQAMPELVKQYGGMHPDRKAQDYVDRVGNEIVEAANRIAAKQSGQNPYQFEFHLLADARTVNAFALPGGQVFITAALYKRLQTRGQLAGVLGHEVGHVLMRHGAQRLAQQKLTQGLVGAAGVAGGDANSAQMAAAIANLVNMKYGRDDELESDHWGVILMAEAGYNPNALVGVMQILEEAGGGGGTPEMLSTHPKPANRQQYIYDVIEKAFPKGLPENLRE